MTDLHDIIRRLERLAPSHRDPFAYHEAKSEILHDLRRLAAANDNRSSRVGVALASVQRRGSVRPPNVGAGPRTLLSVHHI